ncbi:MAG TPA: hypothetical protein VMF69_07955 [Gemmataceae bacterium]|nr:hypothetical protein [Gemmataceae bacterium]
MGANLFFPSLRDRFRMELARRTDVAVDIVWQKAEFVIKAELRKQFLYQWLAIIVGIGIAVVIAWVR